MEGFKDSTRTQYFKGGPVKGPKGAAKVSKVMREFKRGDLHSGSKNGPPVDNPKQAVAIALSEGRKASKKCGGGPVRKAAGGMVGEGREKQLLKAKGPQGDKLRRIEAEEQDTMRQMEGKPVKKGLGGILKKVSPLVGALTGEGIGGAMVKASPLAMLLNNKKREQATAPMAPATGYASGGLAVKRRGVPPSPQEPLIKPRR